MRVGEILSLLSTFASSVIALPEYQDDPYLAYRPPFARSLPVQIMLTGIVLTLTVVLLFHLLFTAQYHWPLAPVNYVLQLSGVVTLLISLIATIHVVLSATLAESVKWPYMLSYIAVNVPPLVLDINEEGWSLAERVTWLLMNASTSGLIQITHIQFLTLLYPSKLEGRLIFALLGPLAIVAAVVQLLPISGDLRVNTMASAVRNVCNATLSLLFTVALFVWGFLVNRKKAWRPDGGTAVFGVAALFLAIVGTALNFLCVHKEDEFVWLPLLIWAVLLWQSFLGWWWWVGAGTGSGLPSDEEYEEEEIARRDAKRERRRREAKEKRKERRVKAQKVWQGVAEAFISPSVSSPVSVSANAEAGMSTSAQLPQTQSRRTRRRNHSNGSLEGDDVGEEDSTPRRPRIHRRSRSLSHSDQSSNGDDVERRSRPDANTASSSGTSSLTLSSSAPNLMSNSDDRLPTRTRTRSSVHTAPRLIPGIVYRWYHCLKTAHNDAARLQAVERVERIRDLGRERRGERQGEERISGWGWSGFDWIGRGRQPENGRQLVVYEMESCDGFTKGREDEDDIHVSQDPESHTSVEHRSYGRTRSPETPVDDSRQQNALHSETAVRPRSFLWWGPLSRWRLQDSTTY